MTSEYQDEVIEENEPLSPGELSDLLGNDGGTTKEAFTESKPQNKSLFGRNDITKIQFPQTTQASFFGAPLEEGFKSQKNKQRSKRSSLYGSSSPEEVILDNERLVEDYVTDHFSLSFAMDAFKIDTKQYVKELSLDGVEQVTDMFFLALKIQKIGLPKLKKFTLTECPFITDQGIKWLSENRDIAIQKISLRGCINLTNKSLHTIQSMVPTPTEIDLSLTSVTCMPPTQDPKTTIKVDGCPLISPPAAMPKPTSHQVLTKDTVLMPYENYKLLVLHDPSDIRGTGIFTKKTLDLSNPTCVEKAWRPEACNPYQYNVYECVTGTGCENWVLSNGCVIVLPFSNTDDKTAKRLATQIISIIGQYPENLFILGGLSNVNEDLLQTMLDKVTGTLKSRAKQLFGALSYKSDDDQVLLEEHKFYDQIQTGLGHTLLDNLNSLLKNKYHLSACSLTNDPKFLFLKSAQTTLKESYPWNNLNFYEETLKAFEAVTAKPHMIASLVDIKNNCPPNLLKLFDSQLGCREISKVLEVLHDRGSCLYFPTIDKKPTFCDLTSPTSLINLGGRAPQCEHIPGVGMDIPCWRTEDFKNVIQGKEGQINLFLDVLTQQGLVFRFPCSLKDPKFTDSFVYVMSEDLPTHPDIPVDEVWPPCLPEGDQQRDIYFTFPSLPQWLFPCFLRKIQETSQIVLMWKSGLVMHQGPVMVLVELLTNELNQDLPVIVISARVQLPSMSDTLYVTFTNVKTILSGLLNSRSVFAVKTICCKMCNPTKNRRLALSAQHNCCHMSEMNFRHLTRKDVVHCKKQNNEIFMTKEEFVDLDLKPWYLIPNHIDITQVATKSTCKGMDKSLRCHLCNNCGQTGISCQGNLEPGITSRHCSCRHEKSLCSYCGTCDHCTQILAEAYAVVYPNFVLSSVNKTHPVGGILAEKAFYDDSYFFPDYLSSTYSPHLSMYLMTEACDFQIYVYSSGITLDYMTATGNVTVNGQAKAVGAMAKLGDHLELKILHQMVEGSQNDVLEFRKNDVPLVSVTIPLNNGPIRVRCDQSLPSKMLVITHNLMAMKNISKTNGTKKSLTGKQENEDVKCCGPFPTVIERQLSFKYKQFEVFLAEKLEKIFQGMAGVLLPKRMTVNNILYPNSEILRGPWMYHPVCTFDITNMEDNADPCGFHLVHLVNGQSLPLPKRITDLLQCIILGMHILLQQFKMDLPHYDQLFPELASAVVEGKCTDTQIRKGVHEILRMTTVNMVFSLFDSFSLDAFQKQELFTSDLLADEITGSLNKIMKENLKKSGLGEVRSLDSEINQSSFCGGFACPGHSFCWQVDSKITEITPNWFGQYSKFITSFQLAGNQLNALPPELFTGLPLLKVLDLRANFLDVLPDTLGLCKRLEELILEGNNLLDLPLTLDGCKELRKLDISLNRMEVLPPIVTKLYNLTHLLAHGLMLTSLPDNFGNLSKLVVLNLNDNCLTKLPKSFSVLQNLRELYLAGIAWIQNKANNYLSKKNFNATTFTIRRWLEANAEKFKDIDMFQYFDEDGSGTLDTQEIARANAVLYQIFPRFEGKGKSSSKDDHSGFPGEILSLKKLKVLDLQYQGIVNVPKGIQNLENLETLRLSNNPFLVSIAAETGLCPLQHLKVNECPLLKTPPKEIRERGFITTYAYLRRLLTGSVDCKRTKLMLVGLGGAGKTSLVKALMTPTNAEAPGGQTTPFDAITGSEPVTDGIDICTWDVDYKGETVSYSVWDFAGQTVYYNTHQFFLSDRAVYLLLWNIRLGHEHAGLNFWLNSITVHAPKAPIFVVGTHTDQMIKDELPIDELRQKYHQIEGFHFVSSLNGKGIPDLKDALFKTTLQQEYMGEKIPQAWLQLEDKIAEKRKNHSINVMDYKEVEAEALEVGIIDQTEVTQAIQFLHDLGMVQHFQNEYLKDRVVINPQWIVDVMACVVSVKQTVVKDGRLMHADIKELWKEYQDMASWLLKLTEEFDLTFQLEGVDCNIVPCLLPEKQPDFEWPEVKKRRLRHRIFETKMVYTFDYLPAGLFNRGQVRLYGISEDFIIWKRGTFLKKNGHKALIQQIGDSELNLKVQGPRPDNLLFLIYELFECLIKESFLGVTYECKIPCPDCVEQYAKFPHMFPASVVRRALEVKAPFLQCHKHFHSTPVLNLQGILAPDDNADFDVHMSQDIFSLQQMQEAMTIDIFISYCNQDAPNDRSKVIHPADVCADLEQEGYTCFFPKGKQLDSREEMAKKLVHASVLLVFVSNSYAANDVCCDIFKYAVNTMKKPTIVVAVGPNFAWKESATLGVFMSDVVFVNMVNSKKNVYRTKFAELLTTLQNKEQLSLTRQETSNNCFISYSWFNSQKAVLLGSRKLPGAVGRGDPREIKTFLEGRGIGCWLDVEQVNVNDQLFEKIAKGLSKARVMVACVSDEYAASSNCRKEMKFAVQLGLPIVIAVVGTGSNWFNSEIGLLATAYPKVNFQHNPNEETYETLIRLVNENMKYEPNENTDTEESKDESEENNQISYQEIYELAQRKLLRQVSNLASTHDIGNYPRLFVVDIEEKSTDIGKMVEYQVHTLCECDQGWHSVADPIVLGTEKRNPDIVEEGLDMNDLDDFTPYLSRVAMVMEHNSGCVLNLYTSTEGQRCLNRIQELAKICPDSVQTSYQSLRVKVHKLDTSGQKGKLIRCRLPSGKIIWLCEEHSVQMKVTVLSEKVAEGNQMVTNQPWLDVMIDILRSKGRKNHPFEFKNNRKAKRKLTDIIAGVDNGVKNLRRSLQRKSSSLKKTVHHKALMELSSQDAAVIEETADYETNTKKKEQKPKKQKHFQEQENMDVKSSTKCSEDGKPNTRDSKEALLELKSQDATVKEETTDSKTKKKKKKKKKHRDFQEQKKTSANSRIENSEGDKNNTEDTTNAKIATKDKRKLVRSVSPNPTPGAGNRTAFPNTQPDRQVRRSTPSPKPWEGKKAEKDLGHSFDQQPVQAKSAACVML